MNELDFLRTRIALEQERLLRLLHAEATRPAEPASPRRRAATLAAEASYLVFTAGRALARDRARAARLEARVAPGDAVTMAAIAGLHATFADREHALAALQRACAAHAGGEAGSPAALVEALRAMARAHTGLSSAWSSLEPLMARHYLIEDWRSTSLVDADTVMMERALFSDLEAAARA